MCSGRELCCRIRMAMPDDIAGAALAPDRSSSATGKTAQAHPRLLEQLENAAIGQRKPDGSIAVRRGDPAGCVLYGPYLHLAEGRYRLRFRCRSGAPRLGAQPVVGVEVIVLGRFQLAWRDFTAGELAAGAASLDFAVPF